MGQNRYSQIADFQARTGLKPATGDRHEIYESMKKTCIELWECLILEQSGICEGDGHWSGCDPIEHHVSNLQDLLKQLIRKCTGKQRARINDTN
jgi:hypothetical protein